MPDCTDSHSSIQSVKNDTSPRIVVWTQQVYYQNEPVTVLEYLPGFQARIRADSSIFPFVVSTEDIKIQQVRLCDECHTEPAHGKDHLCQECRHWESFKGADFEEIPFSFLLEKGDS